MRGTNCRDVWSVLGIRSPTSKPNRSETEEARDLSTNSFRRNDDKYLPKGGEGTKNTYEKNLQPQIFSRSSYGKEEKNSQNNCFFFFTYNRLMEKTRKMNFDVQKNNSCSQRSAKAKTENNEMFFSLRQRKNASSFPKLVIKETKWIINNGSP